MIWKLPVSRTAVASFLVAIILLNIVSIFNKKNDIRTIDSKDGPDEDNHSVLLNEFFATLEEEIIEARKAGLAKEVKDDLKIHLKDGVYTQVGKKGEQKWEEKVWEKVESQVRKEMQKDFTERLFNIHNLNYGFLSEMKQKYYEDHKDIFKDMIMMETLQEVLKNEEDQERLTEKVSSKLESYTSRKEWFAFVLKSLIKDAAPRMDALTEEEEGPDLINCEFTTSSPIYDKKRLSRVKLSKERLADFATGHETLVQNLLAMGPPPSNFGNGEGIVISGGAEYMGGALNAIVQVRETGSKLPIELIINSKSEYDTYICTDLGKQLNFKCLVIEDEIGADIYQELKIEKFQLKILGLLVTTFDHVIALDADNMPLSNPDLLLTSKAYMKTEFLLWPDLWQRTTSPTFYEIAGLKPGEPTNIQGLKNGKSISKYLSKGRNNVHFHDLEGIPGHVSTETGQMVFSKKKHYRSLILALYYNIYGKTHYWRLFYQGSPGDGDRDTFVPALHVFNEPYHIVERATWLAGFVKENGDFQETTIVQYDPETSYNFSLAWKQWLIDQGLDSRMHFNQNNDYTRKLVKKFMNSDQSVPPPSVFFLHVHRPKVNPVLLTDPDGYFEWNEQRNLGLPGAYASEFGATDWDLRFYTIAQWVACDGIKSDAWWKSVNRDQASVCTSMREYVDFLKKDTNDKKAQVFQNVNLQNLGIEA